MVKPKLEQSSRRDSAAPVERDKTQEDKALFNRWTMAGAVALVVLSGYLWSIQSGLWLDDHMHFYHLKELDWSFQSAVDSARLGIVGEVIDLWGRSEAGLEFFRPIAFWIMKIEYTLVNWQPIGMHFFCLVLHFANAMLLGALAMRFFGSRLWATVAACLFALHPGHVNTVYWIACQTELLVTFFLLTGTLAYGRYAGWQAMSFLQRLRGVNSREGQGGGSIGDGGFEDKSANGSRFHFVWGLIALGCYAAAMGCRENAILFPAVCWAGDRLFGQRRRGWLRWEYVVMLAVLVGYFVLRYFMLGGFPLPRKPYYMPISDPQFPLFALEKISLYTLALFSFLPLVPIGGRIYLSARPMLFYGGFGLLGLIGIIVWLAYRRPRSMLWPVVWLGCFLAPVLPVFGSPHHLYLPSVGAVILFTAGLALIGGLTNLRYDRLRKIQQVASGMVLFVLLMVCLLMTWSFGFTFNRGILAEGLLVHDVLNRGREIREGDHLFFINFPMTAYYAIPAIKEKTGLEDIKGHVLAFATQLPRMKVWSEIEIMDRYRLRLRAPESQPYMEGITGNVLLATMGFEEVPEEGERIDAGLFTVIPKEVCERGIRELEFIFDKPLDSPEYHFYIGSPYFIAYPLGISVETQGVCSKPARGEKEMVRITVEGAGEGKE